MMMTTSFTTIRKCVHCAASSGADMKQDLSLLFLFGKIACWHFKILLPLLSLPVLHYSASSGCYMTVSKLEFCSIQKLQTDLLPVLACIHPKITEVDL